MAVVLPFAALRYDPDKVGGLAQVVTQPYDKITPEMQREYFRRSPYNLAYLIKGEAKPSDSAPENVYTRAAGWLQSWREQGVLLQRKTPAIYAYYQEFSPPGTPGATRMIRKGFIGLGRLEPYESGVVFRHERTLSGPKADRLELLRATRAHPESIFMLYSDPERRIESILEEHIRRAPVARVEDEYGVIHTLWEVDEAGAIQALQHEMADKKLIIADGHHRYETALNFARECRTTHPDREADCSFALMTYVNMEGEGIVILPTHRLLAGMKQWNREEFLSKAAGYFALTRYPFTDAAQRQGALDQMRAGMRSAGSGTLGALFYGEDAFYCLETRKDVPWDQLLPDLSPAERSLDVTILHRIALGQCLGIDEESVRKEQHLSYVRHFEEAVEPVLRGAAQACFFLNPVAIQQVREIAFAGRLLPQKSTDFYPKLLSGLVLYALAH
jgi:uncharacterized protein (DUF1015 family)